jgi:ABC-type anion transport system duplicated permease subunit
MIQQFFIDFLGKDLAAVFLIFTMAWMIIVSIFF